MGVPYLISVIAVAAALLAFARLGGLKAPPEAGRRHTKVQTQGGLPGCFPPAGRLLFEAVAAGASRPAALYRPERSPLFAVCRRSR